MWDLFQGEGLDVLSYSFYSCGTTMQLIEYYIDSPLNGQLPLIKDIVGLANIRAAYEHSIKLLNEGLKLIFPVVEHIAPASEK